MIEQSPIFRPFWFSMAIAMVFVLSSSDARASEQSGRVTDLVVRASDGLVLMYLQGARTAKPACATQDYWLVKAENTTAGKQQHATLLAAKLIGKNVRVVGGNQCTRWGDGEDIDSLYILD